MIGEPRQIGLAQQPSGLLDDLDALDLLDADIEEPDRRPLDVEENAGHRRAHDRHVDEMHGVGPDRRPDVEHDAFAAQRRPQGGDRRALDMRHGLEADLRHRHEGAGVAGRDRGIRLAVAHRLDREPHGGVAPPSPHRLARLVLHAHGDVGVAKLDRVLEGGLRVEKRPDHGLVAEHEETQAGMALQCKRGARNHHGGAVIAAHRVERDPHWLRHECLAFPGGENGGK